MACELTDFYHGLLKAGVKATVRGLTAEVRDLVCITVLVSPWRVFVCFLNNHYLWFMSGRQAPLTFSRHLPEVLEQFGCQQKFPGNEARRGFLEGGYNKWRRDASSKSLTTYTQL